MMNQIYFSQFVAQNAVLFSLLLVWSLFWKGIALWTAGKMNHKWWFIILLVLNTAGILEIIYIFVVAKKKWGDIFGNKKTPSESGPTQ